MYFTLICNHIDRRISANEMKLIRLINWGVRDDMNPTLGNNLVFDKPEDGELNIGSSGSRYKQPYS
jgi:hypothetical protein